MQDSDVKSFAEAHAKAVVAGDQTHLMADFDPAAMSGVGAVLAAMPQTVKEANVLSVTMSGDEAVAQIKYDGDDKSTTIESKWAERDGRPKIIGLAVL